MNISNEYPVTIFRKEYEGNVYYDMGLSQKLRDGSYEYGSMPCRFKNGVNLEDKTKIYIKSAWLKFYKKDKATKPYIFVNEYETVGEAIDLSKKSDSEIVQAVMNDDPFKEFASEIAITDEDLPF